MYIFGIDEVIIFFAYGQVFFVLGVVIALQSRKHSRLALAHHLKWLAAFAIVHGLYEWGHGFIPLQAAFLPVETVRFLEAVRTGLLVSSFCLLLRFGVLILGDGRRSFWLLRLLPVGLPLTWIVVSVVAGSLVLDGLVINVRLPESSDSARILLGFTGAALSSAGMLRQAGIVGRMGSRHIAWYFRWSALWFAFYAVVAGLVATRGQWILFGLFDVPFQSSPDALIPAPILRSIAGLAIAFGVIRGLNIFQLEADWLIEERHELQHKQVVQGHLLARVISAQEDERKRVARELHDETGQRLSAVIMGLGTAGECLPRDAVRAGEIIDDVREVAIQALEGVRQITVGLRPTLLDDLGLAPALRRVAEDLTKRSSIPIEVFANDFDGRLPPQVETVFFRILQEGMNNVVRHSGARRAELRLSRTDSEMSAVLEDDGCGFDPREAVARLETGRGLGLVGMRERAASVGGMVVVDSILGGGTRLSVRLPMAERSQDNG